jgi:hypothetical protein
VAETPQRDLASVELWQRSLERSRRRRAAAQHRRRTPRALAGLLAVGALAIAAPAAMADDPVPGLLGYEGQPGNQGDQNNRGTPPPGLLGYEGQPGNQGGLPPGP